MGSQLVKSNGYSRGQKVSCGSQVGLLAGVPCMQSKLIDLSDRAYTTNQYNIFLLFSSSGETTSVITIVIPVVTPKTEELDECPLFNSLHRIYPPQTLKLCPKETGTQAARAAGAASPPVHRDLSPLPSFTL